MVEGTRSVATAAGGAMPSAVEVDERLAEGAELAEVLEALPGTTVNSLGGLGDRASLSLRGSSARQVQVHIDGVPLNPDGADGVDLAELPLAAFSRVEVYRSLPPPSFGAAPMGGVLNLVSATGAPGVRAAGTVGSYGARRLLVHGSGASRGGAQVDATAEGFTSAGDFPFFDDNGTAFQRLDDRFARRANNAKAQWSAQARARTAAGRWRFTSFGSAFSRQEGVPGPVGAPAPTAALSSTRGVALFQADVSAGAWCALARAFGVWRAESFADPAGELGVGPNALDSRFSTAGLLIHAGGAPRPGLVPLVTVQARRDAWSAEDPLAGTPPAPRARAVAAALAVLDVHGPGDRLHASPGVTATVVHMADAPQAIAPQTRADPRLALRWSAAPGLDLRAAGFRAWRVPDPTELFGDRGAIVGNPGLRPESAWTAEIGLRGAWSGQGRRLALEVDHFWKRSTDAIVLVQNAQRVARPVNFGAAAVQGVEAGLDLSPAPWLGLRASFGWTPSVLLTADPAVRGNPVPRLPRWEAASGVFVHAGPHLRLGHDFSWTAANTFDATGIFSAPPRAIHGAFARAGAGPLWAELGVRNLFDRTTLVWPVDPLAAPDGPRAVAPLTDFAGYPLAGRTFLFSLRWEPARSTG